VSAAFTAQHAALVAVGAAFGGVARWSVGVALAGAGPGFPWATLMVNVLGGLAIGVALVVFARQPNEAWRLLLVTGFLGGFTTFSAFSAESLQLLQRGEWARAVVHSLAHTVLALLAAAAGHRAASHWLG
jgi:fluoride exporter